MPNNTKYCEGVNNKHHIDLVLYFYMMFGSCAIAWVEWKYDVWCQVMGYHQSETNMFAQRESEDMWHKVNANRNKSQGLDLISVLQDIRVLFIESESIHNYVWYFYTLKQYSNSISFNVYYFLFEWVYILVFTI
jgi:urate oxidase